MEVVLIFLNGKAESIIINSPTPMLSGTIDALLEANSQGAKWEIDATKADNSKILDKHIFFKRSDGNASAEYTAVGSYHGIQIKTPTFTKATHPEAAGF